MIILIEIEQYVPVNVEFCPEANNAIANTVLASPALNMPMAIYNSMLGLITTRIGGNNPLRTRNTFGLETNYLINKAGQDDQDQRNHNALYQPETFILKKLWYKSNGSVKHLGLSTFYL